MIKSIALLLGTILTTAYLLSPVSAANISEHKNYLTQNNLGIQVHTLKENDKDCGTDVERCIEQGQEDGA